MNWKPIASGLFASHPREVEGAVRVVTGLQEIIKLMREPQGDAAIIVTNVAGGSAVSTIIRRAKAIVSTIGGANSHIVIVARDYNVPCIVGASDLDLELIANGARMRLNADGTIELDANRTPIEQMQVLRSIVFSGVLNNPDDVVGFAGDFKAALQGLINKGLVENDGIVVPSNAGIALINEWYARDRQRFNADQIEAFHADFRPLDIEVKRLSSKWQRVDTLDDWDGRLKTVEELSALHASTMRYLERFVEVVPRFSEYRDRFTRALHQIQEGNVEYFVSVQVDSYHTVWFNFHEDLLRLFQREREPE